jgi:hypothetical protein
VVASQHLAREIAVFDKRTGCVLAVVSLCCVPSSLASAQNERIPVDLVATHTVELRELLRIGSLEGPTDAFGNVGGVALGPANRLYVADDLSHDVRVFDADGVLVRVIGRKGQGPGEFELPWEVAVDDADTLMVWDQRLMRVSVFDPQGGFRRSFRVPRQWLVNSVRIMPNGNLLLAAFGSADSYGLHVLDRDGELISEFGPVEVDPNIYAGFVGSLYGGAADMTGAGEIVYTRKSPYELLLFDSKGKHLKSCVGAEDWTTDPREVVEQHPDRVAIHWEQFVHSSRVFAIEGGRYLNLVIDRPNSRTILDIVSPDCRLLCRHAFDEMLVVEDVRQNRLVATLESDFPQVIVFEFSVQGRR